MIHFLLLSPLVVNSPFWSSESRLSSSEPSTQRFPEAVNIALQDERRRLGPLHVHVAELGMKFPQISHEVFVVSFWT